MYIDFAADWPAYIAMVIFISFIVYVIIKGHSKTDNMENSAPVFEQSAKNANKKNKK